MRKLNSWLLALCLFLPACAESDATEVIFMGFGLPSPECAGKLVCQNFEGTGYDNRETWTELGTTLDEDYTATVLRGSQSLYMTDPAGGTSPNVTVSHTAADPVWGHMLYRTSDGTPAANHVIVKEMDAAVADVCLIQNRTTGVLRVYCGTAFANTVTTVADNTTYNVWWYYDSGTGANAECRVGISTDGTRPSSGNGYAVTTTGTSTTSAAQVQLRLSGDDSATFLRDQVYVDDASFTTVDP